MAGAVTAGAGVGALTVGAATAGVPPVGIGDADAGGRQPTAAPPKAASASGPLTISSPRSTNDSSFGYRLMPGTWVPVALLFLASPKMRTQYPRLMMSSGFWISSWAANLPSWKQRTGYDV